jgi:hypothetical protein
MAIQTIKRVLLWTLGILLTVVGIANNPMLLIFPMWIFTYLKQATLRRWVKRVSLSISFIGFGLFFGLLTEAFAILNNRHLPPQKRILLSPDPVLDLAYGFVYYLMLILTWFALIKRFRYSRMEVFIITGMFGIMTEEVGQVFVRIFRAPVIGLLYTVIVSFVYGIFPMLAYIVSEEKLGIPKRGNFLTRFLAAAVALFLQWAVFGLLVLPALKGPRPVL